MQNEQPGRYKESRGAEPSGPGLLANLLAIPRVLGRFISFDSYVGLGLLILLIFILTNLLKAIFGQNKPKRVNVQQKAKVQQTAENVASPEDKPKAE
jgi:hypothetical protein